MLPETNINTSALKFEDFFDSIKPKLIIREPEVSTDIIEEDLQPQTYRIRVFNLNTETGNCKAYFYPDDSENNWKIHIRINKSEHDEYFNSMYSKSLDEKKVINITGIGEKTNGQITSIHVDL